MLSFQTLQNKDVWDNNADSKH